MSNQFELLLAGGEAPFSLAQLLLNLAVGLVMGLLLRWHLLKFGPELANRDELGGVLPFILLTTVLIITVVKSSLALSLGLVGALSIVRFRTPIKEPEELAYLFIAIALGLGLGANQLVATVVAGIFILTMIVAIKQFAGRARRKNIYLSLNLQVSATGASQLDVLNDLIVRYVDSSDLRRSDERTGALEVTFLLDITSVASLDVLSDALHSRFPGIEITYLDQNGMPGI
jgi:Domain of unknown function (DUF4956)